MERKRGLTRTRHWLSFSLRNFLLFVLLASLASGWIGIRLDSAGRQADAVKAILAAGGQVAYESPVFDLLQRRPPLWMRRLLGPDFFRHVTEVNLRYTYAGDAELEHIQHLTRLQSLDMRYTFASDAGLRHLRELDELRELRLAPRNRDAITNSGVEHLLGLSKLEQLELRNLQLTDAGLPPSEAWPRLQSLCLCGTKVSDAGMQHLTGRDELQTLIVSSTQVTKDGVEELQLQLPACEIVNVNR